MTHSHDIIDDHLNENSKTKLSESSEKVTSQLDDILQTDLPQDAYTQIFNYMHSINKETDYYSEGYNGRVYVVDVTINEGKHQKFLVVKCRKNQDENEKLIFEYYNHLKMYRFSKKYNSPFIWVPKVYGIKNDDDGEMYLIMDFIEGMTLYSYKLSKVLPLLYQELVKEMGELKAKEILWPIEDYSDCKIDKDIKKKIELLLSVFKRYPENEFYDNYLWDFSLHQMEWTYKEQKQARIFDRLSADFGLWSLSPNTVEVLQDALVAYISSMHQEWLYHNDTTHRNIILGEDGKIYFIDFDKSGTERERPRQAKLSISDRHTKKYKWHYIEGDYRVIGDLDSLKLLTIPEL